MGDMTVVDLLTAKIERLEATYNTMVKGYEAQLATARAEVETMRDAASKEWPMSWQAKPTHEWDDKDIANYVAGFWRHQHANALRDVRERVEKLELYWSETDDGMMTDKDGKYVSVGGAFFSRDDVLALLGGEG